MSQQGETKSFIKIMDKYMSGCHRNLMRGIGLLCIKYFALKKYLHAKQGNITLEDNGVAHQVILMGPHLISLSYIKFVYSRVEMLLAVA